MAKRGRGRPKKTVSGASGASAEFFKVFLPHLNSQQLMIPPDFIKHFKRTIRERVILKDLSGKMWHVDVEETLKGVFLKNGWQSFVSYHCLKVGDFLVFRYNGSYSFVVKIYGTNGCKKETNAPENIATRVKIEAETEEEEEIEAKHNSPKRARQFKEDLSNGRSNGLDEEKELDEAENVVADQRPENCYDLKNAESDDSKCPYFIASASKSIQYKVEIPNEVKNEYNLHLKPEMVLRNSNGKEWPVRVYTSKDGRTYIGKGWSAFQKDNDVGFKESYYIFTFETERSSKTIHVQISHVRPDVLHNTRMICYF